MNQRIRELAHEAGLPTYNPEGIPTKLEKFAQLIVQECMQLNSKELSITAIERLLPMYREHFGVEE
jgi:hypothetical protein